MLRAYLPNKYTVPKEVGISPAEPRSPRRLLKVKNLGLCPQFNVMSPRMAFSLPKLVQLVEIKDTLLLQVCSYILGDKELFGHPKMWSKLANWSHEMVPNTNLFLITKFDCTILFLYSPKNKWNISHLCFWDFLTFISIDTSTLLWKSHFTQMNHYQNC